MGGLPDGAHLLHKPMPVPPRKQRILAPSLVKVIDANMGSEQCVCSLRITDPVNLAIYYVPMTRQMVEQLQDELDAVVPSPAEQSRNEGRTP